MYGKKSVLSLTDGAELINRKEGRKRTDMKRQSSYHRNHRSSAKKEKIVMIASSAFVLAALTMTGVYVKNSNEKERNDGYTIDFSALENQAQQQAQQLSEQLTLPNVTEDDLDYMPLEQVDSGTVEIPGLTGGQGMEAEPENPGQSLLEEAMDAKDAVAEQAKNKEQEEAADREGDAGQGSAAGQQIRQSAPSFQAGEQLVWPVNGNVLIPYSMDKTVYFSTLDQYKYSPAMVLAADEGSTISSVASGTVTQVFYDEEIGNAVTVEIGNGYQVTYGQLKEIAVAKGSYLEKGSVIGYVAAPTKYYSAEGTNAYFALTLNGEPADPLGALQ